MVEDEPILGRGWKDGDGMVKSKWLCGHNERRMRSEKERNEENEERKEEVEMSWREKMKRKKRRSDKDKSGDHRGGQK